MTLVQGEPEDHTQHEAERGGAEEGGVYGLFHARTRNGLVAEMTCGGMDSPGGNTAPTRASVDLLREDDVVDHMDDAIAGHDVRFDDLGIVDVHALVADLQLDCLSVHGLCFRGLHRG